LISLRFDQLAAITGGTLYHTGNASRSFRGVSIDSRSTKADELFFAIRGARNDGHDFIDQAVQKGASGIVAEFTYPKIDHVRKDVAVVAVHNSHEAMIKLAKMYRETSQARFVAITGSNGKTTTKELAFSLINAVKERAYCSPGNLNNLYGVPLALFAMPADSTVAIMELGISTPGEMTRLAEVIRPDVIVITNVGPSHLEFLDSVEAVARAKLELVQAASEDVPLIVNADDAVLMAEVQKLRSNLITFAVDSEADVTPESIKREGPSTTLVTIDSHTFRLPLAGKHQVYNLLAAYAVFSTLGFTFENYDTLSVSLGTAPMRGQIVQKNNITFFADCYNANPVSVKAGLETFFETPGGKRRIVILGDMLELGASGAAYHREIGRVLSKHSFDLAAFVGDLSKHTMKEVLSSGIEEHKVRHYDNSHECARSMVEYFRENDFIFVKASRGIGLEAVIDAVEPIEETD
jgi:UDP-N-acetylmuramoyl-tripeptide--D-alanyl-D-alanine ligase